MEKKEFEFLLSKGEDYKTEFKENLSGIDKDIVAFANTDGGIILVGVTDTGKVKGFALSNKLKAEIQAVARNCDPAILIEISEQENVSIIVIQESTTKPHKCSTGFYLRNGATSQKLTVDEIRKLFNKEGQLLYEEMINKNFTLHDFDHAKFDEFLKKANISKTLPETDLLQNLGLTTENGFFKNAAILLFGKNMERFIPQGIITCVLYKGTDKVFIIDRKDYKNDIISNYNEAMAFLYRHLKLRYEIKGFGPRKEILELPKEALKEAVVNAICHRDYGEKGAVIQIDVFDDRVDISNPGGLIFKEADFGKKSVSRNPLLFGLLQRIELVEHVGSGILRIRNAAKEAGISEPKFEFTTFFTVTFLKPKVWGEEETREKTRKKTREKMIALITNNPKMTIEELAKELDITEKGVEWQITQLKKQGILRRVGSDKGGYWEIIVG